MTAGTIDPAELVGIRHMTQTWRFASATLDALAEHLVSDRQLVERLFIARALVDGIDLDPFELRRGNWYIDLPRATARAVLNGTVLTLALAAINDATLPAVVLSVVVPLLFDVEHVKLSATDRYVYALLRHTSFDIKPIDDWYSDLPSSVRHEIEPLEFRELVERLGDAGLVSVDFFDQLQLRDVKDRRLVRLELPPLAR